VKKTNITLNEDCKSFKNDFTKELEGDLIILSGVNGSGKSQLMNIIYGFQNNSTINRELRLDNGFKNDNNK
jgi:ABC-type lipoprotein export system ATPase subunit